MASTVPSRVPSIPYLSKISTLSDSFSFNSQRRKPKEDEPKSSEFVGAGLRPLLGAVSIQEAPNLNSLTYTVI